MIDRGQPSVSCPSFINKIIFFFSFILFYFLFSIYIIYYFINKRWTGDGWLSPAYHFPVIDAFDKIKNLKVENSINSIINSHQVVASIQEALFK